MVFDILDIQILIEAHAIRIGKIETNIVAIERTRGQLVDPGLSPLIATAEEVERVLSQERAEVDRTRKHLDNLKDLRGW